MPRQDAEQESGLNPAQLLNTFWNVFQACQEAAGRPTVQWEDLDDSQIGGFEMAVARGRVLIEEADGARWNDLAGRLHDVFMDAIDSQARYRDRGTVDRLVWEAATRHLCNAMVYDADDDGTVESHQDRMVAWFQARLRETEETATGPQA